MPQFKISPLMREKPIRRPKIPWLRVIIFIGIAAAGCLIFRLNARIAELELQIVAMRANEKEASHVFE
jgi:hypothetical protein